MYLKHIAGLASFVAEGERTAEELAKFLVLRTFRELSPKAIYISELSSDGCLVPIASFGIDKLRITQWGKFHLSFHLTITECARQGETIIIRSPDDLFTRYPLAKEIEDIHTDWKTSIVFSILPLGVCLLMLDDQPSDSEDELLFLEAVGAILVLQLSRIPIYKSLKVNSANNGAGTLHIELTERQKVIHELMFKGFTNAQIAVEVGYSESLVRQETIHIFRVLGVSGRKEIIESPPPPLFPEGGRGAT